MLKYNKWHSRDFSSHLKAWKARAKQRKHAAWLPLSALRLSSLANPAAPLSPNASARFFLTADGITATTELLLIAAARAQHVAEIIRPALEANQTVICDRFIDATVAYQGYRGGIDIAFINQLNRVATCGITPTLTFVLDLPPEVGLQRQRQLHRNRLDKEALVSHRKVREGYRAIAAAEPHRVKLIDATQCPDVVHAALLAEYRKKTRSL